MRPSASGSRPGVVERGEIGERVVAQVAADRDREHAAMQHARGELGVGLLRLAGGERGAVRAVDVRRQRDLLAVVVAERAVVRVDRALDVALARSWAPSAAK